MRNSIAPFSDVNVPTVIVVKRMYQRWPEGTRLLRSKYEFFDDPVLLAGVDGGRDLVQQGFCFGSLNLDSVVSGDSAGR